MKKLPKILKQLLFSITSMMVLIGSLAIVIGMATFIENDFGSRTAWAVIYGARWFEMLFAFLSINLLVNTIRFRMWRKDKWPLFLIHFAIIIILAGTGVTRYTGYETFMHIREGEMTNKMISDRTYFQINIQEENRTASWEKALLLSPLKRNRFIKKIKINNRAVTVRLDNVIFGAEKKIIEDPNGSPLLLLHFSDGSNSQQIVLQQGETRRSSYAIFNFETEEIDTTWIVRFKLVDNELYLSSNKTMLQTSMKTKQRDFLKPNNMIKVEPYTLYTYKKSSFAVEKFLLNGQIQAVPAFKEAQYSDDQGDYTDALIIDVHVNGNHRRIPLFGETEFHGEVKKININGMTITLSFGPKIIFLPFMLKLSDFKVERYPGSMQPSSFISDVVVIDPEKQIEFNFPIFMNHVLKYRGFRFFQSSFDMDEKGTVLTVQSDPGTPVVYIGFFILSLALIIHLVHPKSRFRKQKKALSQFQDEILPKGSFFIFIILFFILGTTNESYGTTRELQEEVQSVNYSHSRKFGGLLVQDIQGRIKPINTLGHEVLNKITRKTHILNNHSDQVILGMLIRPYEWQKVPMIRVNHPKLKKMLNLDQKQTHCSFLSFFDSDHRTYRLAEVLSKIQMKPVVERTKYEKEILRVDERLNICYMIYSGHLFRIFPDSGSLDNKWLSIQEISQSVTEKHQQQNNSLIKHYFQALNDGLQGRSWEPADQILEEIKTVQRLSGDVLIPSERKNKAEIIFHESRIFNRISPVYLSTGSILLLISMMMIFMSQWRGAWIVKILIIILSLGFIGHTFGLILRWYISGHAPWSNGYESMIYASWATVFAGMIFSRNGPMVLGATGFLAGLILVVAHLSWMDPQITQLVPVLKSHWLTIHVSVIMASYGFLGLSAILSFLTLILFIFTGKNSFRKIEQVIIKSTMITEKTLFVGLTLLVIGTIFGAIWANESWGRYWGWDPKESWTLVTILVYTLVIHLRFVSQFRSSFYFHTATLFAFFSVLMTYFGVNFYLSGLHSYVEGDPLVIPPLLYVVIGLIIIIVLLGYRNRHMKMRLQIGKSLN